MEFNEPFEESIEIVRGSLADVDGPQILIGVTDDTALRDYFLEELRKKLDGGVELREFRYQPRRLSLLEGVQQNGADGNRHRIAVSAIGLEALPHEEQQNAIKLLNAERNRLGYANRAVLLWLNRKLFADVANKSYDFFSGASQTFFLEAPSDWSAEQRLESQRRSYLRAIVDQNQYVNLQGLAPMRGGQLVQMRMEEIFIPLHVEQEVRSFAPEQPHIESEREVEETAMLHGSGITLGPSRRHRSVEIGGYVAPVGRVSFIITTKRPAEIPDLLRERRAIVLGDPGAGKTTMLRYVAYRAASEMLGRCSTGSVSDPLPDETSAPGGPGRSRSPHHAALPGEIADCLPVYVRIGLYAQHLEDNRDATIAEFAPKQNYQLPLTEELLQHEMARGKALFLLDGLDEIVDTARRQDVARRAIEFARDNPDCPVIVTSRIVGYAAASLGASFEQFTVRPFDDEEIESFVRHWYQTLGEADRADDLIKSLKGNPSVRRLATNPLLLTVTALIHRRKTKLPNRRIELYKDAAQTLADSWMSERRLTPDDWDAEEALNDLLPAIAWRLHTESSGGLIGQEALHQLLVETMRARNPRLTESDAQARAAQFRRNVSEFSGIFLERGLDEAGQGLYGFLHLTFEEYFAAVQLKDNWKRGGFQVLKPLLHHPRWNEVILLAAGAMDQFDATRFVEAILGAHSLYDAILHRDLLLAARVLADDVRIDPPLRRQVVAALADLYFADSSPHALCEDIRETIAGLAGTFAHDDAVDVLVKRTFDNEASVRSAAASALSAMGERAASEGVIEKLLGLLADTEWSVRSAAASALGAMGERAASEGVIEKLLGLLADTEGSVQSAAARALSAMGERAASEGVIEKWLGLLASTEGYVRSAAASALGAMGERAASEGVIEKLLGLLADTEWSVRYAAASALGAMGERAASEGVIEKLLGLLADTEGSVRSAAADALSAMGERAASEGVIEKLLGLLASTDGDVRYAAARALSAMGERAASEGVIEKLLGLLASTDGDVRSAAARALSAMGERAASEGVIEKLLGLLADTEWSVRSAAARALGAMGERAASEGVIEKLLGLLADTGWSVRSAAARALGAMGERAASEGVIEKLLGLLADTEGSVRSAAADALSAMGERAASEGVIEKLLGLLASTEGSVRSAAARALSAMGERAASEGVIEKLLGLLADTEWSVRFAAASALGAMGERAASEGVIEKLLGLLADTEWPVRYAAARALSAMGERAASEGVIEKLLGLLASTEGYVRSEAASALSAMGERVASEEVIEKLLGLLADTERGVRYAAASALGALSSKLAPPERGGVAALALPFVRKRGKSEKVQDQRNGGYVVLRNVMAAGTE